jgi:hypothetical protein
MITVPFMRKSLDNILSGFNKTLEDLKALQEKNEADRVEKSAKVIELESEMKSLVTESAKAAKIHAKISEIVS